jgi:hypothetical protein
MSRRQRGTGSVFRPEGSSVWWVQYYQNGVRQRESAETADRREALDVLKRRVAEVNTGNVARSLLIQDGGSHDVRGSALVALVKIQLRYGCHSVVPDLATACDTSPFD